MGPLNNAHQNTSIVLCASSHRRRASSAHHHDHVKMLPQGWKVDPCCGNLVLKSQTFLSVGQHAFSRGAASVVGNSHPCSTRPYSLDFERPPASRSPRCLPDRREQRSHQERPTTTSRMSQRCFVGATDNEPACQAKVLDQENRKKTPSEGQCSSI